MIEAEGLVKVYRARRREVRALDGALIGRPRLLFLDEPTTGLDPRSRLAMWDVIRTQVRQGTTLLLTTQYLAEWNPFSALVAATRDLFGNPNPFAAGSFPGEHSLELSLL